MSDPSSAPPDASLAPSVAVALREQLPAVARRTVAAVIAEVPDYADPLSGRLGVNITRAVEVALATFLRLAEDPSEADSETRVGPAVEAAYALGRGEARSGRSMNALLSAYRVGARVAWEQWGAAALAAGVSPTSLVTFAALVFAYIDQLSAASVSGHADELATTGRVRQQYLDRLAGALLGGAPAAELEHAAQRAEWVPPNTLTCVIAPSAHTPHLRARLGTATLSVSAETVDPQAPADLTVHLAPDLGTRRDTLTTRASVVGPERPWTDAVESYRRARRALDLYGARAGVIDTEAHLADLVVTADPAALADLRAVVLAPLAGLRPDTAARLARTLLVWLLHQGRRDLVARDLVVHPQTVRYRMSQIRQLFGDRLNDPRHVRDLVIALTPDHTAGGTDPA